MLGYTLDDTTDLEDKTFSGYSPATLYSHPSSRSFFEFWHELLQLAPFLLYHVCVSLRFHFFILWYKLGEHTDWHTPQLT